MNNDLICVGNAIIDIVSTIDDKLLNEFELVKGSMKIVSNEDFNVIFEKLKNYDVISGGSAANTAVGFASLGGKSHFIGQIGNDDFGKLFQKISMRKMLNLIRTSLRKRNYYPLKVWYLSLKMPKGQCVHF